MALSALIFDLDGTLIDANALHARAWCEAFEDFGFYLPEDRIIYEIGKGGSKLVPALVGEAAEAASGEGLRTRHDERYMEMVEEEPVRVFPEVHALFEALRGRGLKIAVATASKRASLEKVLKETDLDLFALADEVVTDSDVEHSKPAPDTVTAAVRKLDLSPAECAMVGDTPYDAEACRRAGVVCLGVLTGVHPAQAMHRAGARASYEDVSDLLKHLDEALEKASPGTALLTREHMAALMEEALSEAQAGLSEGERPIGSVVARGDGTIVARGRNRARAAGSRLAHAELRALQEAGSQAPEEARDLLLVTTLEPCAMCLGAALAMQVDTILYALEAPPSGGAGRCTPPDDTPLPRIVGGVRRAESRALLAEWLSEHPDDVRVQQLLAETAGQGALKARDVS